MRHRYWERWLESECDWWPGHRAFFWPGLTRWWLNDDMTEWLHCPGGAEEKWSLSGQHQEGFLDGVATGILLHENPHHIHGLIITDLFFALSVVLLIIIIIILVIILCPSLSLCFECGATTHPYTAFLHHTEAMKTEAKDCNKPTTVGTWKSLEVGESKGKFPKFPNPNLFNHIQP